MTEEQRIPMTPRLEEALEELKALIAARRPEATFSVGKGYDPHGIHLTATVDIDDRGEVIDLFIDRLVEEELPIFVALHRTPERNAAIWAGQGEPAAALAKV